MLESATPAPVLRLGVGRRSGRHVDRWLGSSVGRVTAEADCPVVVVRRTLETHFATEPAAALCLPPLRALLDTEPLTVAQVALCGAAAAIPAIAVPIGIRRRHPK